MNNSRLSWMFFKRSVKIFILYSFDSGVRSLGIFFYKLCAYWMIYMKFNGNFLSLFQKFHPELEHLDADFSRLNKQFSGCCPLLMCGGIQGMDFLVILWPFSHLLNSSKNLCQMITARHCLSMSFCSSFPYFHNKVQVKSLLHLNSQHFLYKTVVHRLEWWLQHDFAIFNRAHEVQGRGRINRHKHVLTC